MRLKLFALLAAAVLILAACGGGDGEATEAPADQSTGDQPAASETTDEAMTQEDTMLSG